MKKILIALLLLPALLQAQDFSHRYFHYNQYFDAAAPFTITANTADGADTNAISISGGGTCDSTRGACVTAYGNEHGYLGQLWLAAANAGASSQINFYTRGSQVWTMPGAATAATSDLVFGLSSVASSVATIRGARADASDDGELNITGGGACAVGRGACITPYGNDHASYGGKLLLRAGDKGSTAKIQFRTGGDYNRLTIPYMSDVDDVDLVLGEDNPTAPVFSLKAATADGDDDGTLNLCSGGACANTRGAFMTLYGAEHATLGGNISFDLGTNGYKYEFGGGAAATAYYFMQGNNTNLVFGPANPTAPSYIIRAQTSDADDDATLGITPGGAGSSARGPMIWMYGNETASYGGSLYFQTGNVASRALFFQTYDGSSASNRLTIPTNTDTDNVDLVLGNVSTTAPVFIIRGQTADADDDGVLYLTGAGATGPSRGGQIELDGNEIGSSQDGRIMLAAGDDSAGGYIGFNTGNGYRNWTIPYTASDAANDLVFGTATTVASVANIRGARADGSDDGVLQLNGGGAYGYTRGSSIALQGNENASGGGDLYVTAGNSGGSVWLRTSATDEMVLLGASSVTVDRGAYLQVRATTEELTIAAGEGAAGKVTVGNICVSGLILGVSVRVTQAPGGGAATFNVGCTGSGNLDQFISGLSTALSTTGIYPTNGDGSNTVGWAQKTATTMTVTTNANVTGASMKVRIVVYYLTPSALSS